MGGVTLELAEEIQDEFFAHDIPMPDLEDSRWSESTLRSYFESGGGGVEIPQMMASPKAPAVKARLEAQSVPARGDAIAEIVQSNQQAAETRRAAALEARVASAAKENEKVSRIKGDRDAFDSFIQESRRELSELSQSAASTNRNAALDDRRNRAAAESLKVRAGIASAQKRAEGEAVIKEIKHNEKMSAAAQRKADVLAARQQKAADLATGAGVSTPIAATAPLDTVKTAATGGSRPSGLQIAAGVAIGALAVVGSWVVTCGSSEPTL